MLESIAITIVFTSTMFSDRLVDPKGRTKKVVSYRFFFSLAQGFPKYQEASSEGSPCTYFLDIAKLRYTIFFILCDNLKNEREGVSECQNMKVKHPAVILRPSLQRLDKYKSSIAQPISREITFFP